MQISLRVGVSDALVAACGGAEWGCAGVVWRSFSRDAQSEPVVAAIHPGEVLLTLDEGAPDALALQLPAELGGPHRSGLGYVAAFDRRALGDVIAWAPRDRVLHMQRPFPVNEFARFMRADAGAGVSEVEQQRYLTELGQLPVGFSLAQVDNPTRSLLGFVHVDEASRSVELCANTAWPPPTF